MGGAGCLRHSQPVPVPVLRRRLLRCHSGASWEPNTADDCRFRGSAGQVFTIINDENYYYPDLARGMIVDEDNAMGIDVAAYTGSTTGTTRNNQVCSAYTPITWQVDRKCHLISAS